MKAFKAFDKNLQCRGFQFEVGKEYKHKGKIELCRSGFHACENISNVFNFYEFRNAGTRVCEVEILGEVETEPDNVKLVTDHIKIARELSWEEVLKLCNSGDWNSGDCNSGNRNSGDCNSGNRNSGDWNSGDCNSGNRNSGNWNSGNWNSGIFNTDQPDKVRVFNKWISREDYKSIYFPRFLYFKPNVWVSHDTASQEEKEKYKQEIETCGGFVKTLDYKEAFKLSWDRSDKEERIKIKDVPGFDKDMFFEISGINVDEE